MFAKGFIFTKQFPERVTIHNKNSRRNKHLRKIKNYEFHWRILRRGSPIPFDGILYTYARPQKSLEFELTNSGILEKLELDELFDFEYKPEEFDNLQFAEETPFSPYLSLVYFEGKWEMEMPNHEFEWLIIHNGYVKPLD